MFGWLKRSRRRRLLREPVPRVWREILSANVGHFSLLRETEQDRLLAGARVLDSETYWEGCNGLTVTEEMRVTIAGQAALLQVGWNEFPFSRLQTVLLYPAGYLADKTVQRPGGIVEESRDHRLGEAWHHGPIILSWEDVLDGTRNPFDGHNVVLHEFAHFLDMLDGFADGVPLVKDAARWTEEIARAHSTLTKLWAHGRRIPLDPYALENRAEFFAVSTEVFFERPIPLRRDLPQIYRMLSDFYQQDPAQWPCWDNTGSNRFATLPPGV